MKPYRPRLRSIRPGDKPYTVVVRWTNNRLDTIDLTGLVHRAEAFAPLREPEAFREVRAIAHGWGIGWPGDLDYGADTLRRLAEEQREMGAKDFARWRAAQKLSIHEAADVLGVNPSTVKSYARGARIPKVVQIACRAIAEDHAILDALYRPRHAGRPRKESARRPASAASPA